jgi:hypothetical protein
MCSVNLGPLDGGVDADAGLVLVCTGGSVCVRMGGDAGSWDCCTYGTPLAHIVACF